ncbi:MAG: ethanolamine utilization protein EutJ [Acidobacteria bacterium]|nr:MAG: ethanolamine utilization protein EutJ [Acidobacteriota bacterium]
MSTGRWLRLPAVALVSACLSCQVHTRPRLVLRIGVLVNLSGPFAETSGQPTVDGARLAARMVNASGGLEVGGDRYEVELVIKDFPDRTDAATGAARALINQDRVDVIVGPQFSRHAIPVSTVCENARLPMVSPMSSNPETTLGKHYVFRLAFDDAFQARVMARFALEDLAARRAGILFNVSSTYSRNLAALFQRTFEEGEGQIVGFEKYTGDEAASFDSQLARIAAAQPDVLYLPNLTSIVMIQVRQARELGIDATLLGSDTWDLQLLAGLPEAEGSFVTHQWHPDIPSKEGESFVERYQNAYGDIPKTTAAMTYDALGLIFRAIQTEGAIGAEAIRAGLLKTQDYAGATGAISYKGTGDPERSAVIVQTRGGRATLHRLVAP